MTWQLSYSATALVPLIALVTLVTLVALSGLVGRGPPPAPAAAAQAACGAQAVDEPQAGAASCLDARVGTGWRAP